jgi:Fic family protein
VDVSRFENSPVGHLTSISGTDAYGAVYEHQAFIADPLEGIPTLSGMTWARVGAARAAIGRLHQGARFVGNVALLRQPNLRREAQSTSALEGTFAPIDEVLAADVIEQGNRSGALNEVMNFVAAAEYGYRWVAEGRAITVALLCAIHQYLVQGTTADTADGGRIRQVQVVIGNRSGRVEESRFVPMPPGILLEAAVTDLIDWINAASADAAVDPVVAAAVAHYQFETLHPFNDGNGRVGRLLIVLQLLQHEGVLPDSLLTVSPWFEQRREQYQDALAEVSASGDWDQWVSFFANGLEAAAISTAHRIEGVLDVKDQFHRQLVDAKIRGLARDIADFMVPHPFATLTQIAGEFGKPYQSIKDAVERLKSLGIVEDMSGGSQRIIRAPAVLNAYRI